MGSNKIIYDIKTNKNKVKNKSKNSFKRTDKNIFRQ
jgi:hypothetical protein